MRIAVSRVFVPQRRISAPPAEGDVLAHGMTMIAAPVSFGVLGWWIDSLLGTSPIFLLVLAAFGVAASFASAYYRYEQRVSASRRGQAVDAALPGHTHGRSPTGGQSMSAPVIVPPRSTASSCRSRGTSRAARRSSRRSSSSAWGSGAVREGAAAVVLAFAIVVANFIAAAALMGWAARTSPGMLMAVALFGFILRLAVITAIGVGIKELDIVDWPVFCITLLVGYAGLLVWELRSVSFQLANPGVIAKPKRDKKVTP